MTRETVSKYFQQGFQAQCDHKPRESCRYRAEAIVTEWVRGWDASRQRDLDEPFDWSATPTPNIDQLMAESSHLRDLDRAVNDAAMAHAAAMTAEEKARETYIAAGRAWSKALQRAKADQVAKESRSAGLSDHEKRVNAAFDGQGAVPVLLPPDGCAPA